MKSKENPAHGVPSWVQDAVFYQIFPDRFRRSDQYRAQGQFSSWGAIPTRHNLCGGNLRGIIEGLDHIEELGCNALYLCPIFASTSNHRYHTLDYYKIDPVLGTDSDFEDLVSECHKRKVRLILDGVFNHCSRGLFQFNSLLEMGAESPYADWFHVREFPVNAYGSGDPNYACWWGIRDLPKFNTNNPEVREFLWGVGEYWVGRGIDGWRLDVPNEIDDDSFWQEFRKRVRAVNSEAYIVGEIWGEPSRWLAGDQFDGVMNYPLRRVVLETLFPEAMSKPDNLSTGEPAVISKNSTNSEQSAQVFCKKIMDCFPTNRFGTPLNLLGSHDNIRMATLAQGENDLLSLAWAILMMMPGAPSVYYGDEMSLFGGKDPDNRRCFPWEQWTSVKQHSRMWKEIKQWIHWRRQYPVLCRGALGCEVQGQKVVIWRSDSRLKARLSFEWPERIDQGAKHPWQLEFIANLA